MRASRSEAERPCSRAKGDRTTGRAAVVAAEHLPECGVEGEGEVGFRVR